MDSFCSTLPSLVYLFPSHVKPFAWHGPRCIIRSFIFIPSSSFFSFLFVSSFFVCLLLLLFLFLSVFGVTNRNIPNNFRTQLSVRTGDGVRWYFIEFSPSHSAGWTGLRREMKLHWCFVFVHWTDVARGQDSHEGENRYISTEAKWTQCRFIDSTGHFPPNAIDCLQSLISHAFSAHFHNVSLLKFPLHDVITSQTALKFQSIHRVAKNSTLSRPLIDCLQGFIASITRPTKSWMNIPVDRTLGDFLGARRGHKLQENLIERFRNELLHAPAV